MTAVDIAPKAIFQAFDIHLGAKVGNHRTQYLWTQLSKILKLLLGYGFFRNSPRSTSLLNRLDTTFLLFTEIAFRH
jgi:hypothetical protein